MLNNITFSYLYRDASNYKRRGEIILAGSPGLDAAQAEQRVRAALERGEYFIARQVRVAEVFFDTFAPQDDHCWHELAGLSPTIDAPTDVHGRDIAAFVAEIEQAGLAGWDEKQVPPEYLAALRNALLGNSMPIELREA